MQRPLFRPAVAALLLLVELPAGWAQEVPTEDSEAQEPAVSSDERWILGEEIDVQGEMPRATLIEGESAGPTRTRTPLIEVPQSVQVLNRMLLEEQQIRTLDQALVNVSGVVPSKPEELVLQQPLVRGFPAEVFIDGLQAFGLTPIVDPASTINIERIEVLKGPTSTLFGGGLGAPLGGLVNLVSKRPFNKPRYEVGIQLGDFGTREALFDLNQPVGGRAAFRVTGQLGDTDGYIDHVESERLALFPSFSAALSDRTDLVIRLQWSRVENLEYTGLPASITLDGDFGVDPYRFSGASDAPRTVIENQLWTARLDHRFSSSLEGVVEARSYHSTFDEFSTFPFFAFFPPDPGRPTEIALFSGQLPTEVRQWSLSPRVEWNVGSGRVRHRLLAGLDVDRTAYDAATGIGFFPIGVLDYADPEADLSFGEVPALSSFQDDTYDTLAVSLQDQVELGNRVSLLAGLRFTRQGIEQLPSFDETYEEVTPRLGLTVKLGAGFNAFAGYAEGFRAVLFLRTPDGAPPKLQASRHLEIGLKGSRPGLQGSVALYRLVRSNVPTPDPDNPFAQVQTGEQRSQGAELDLLWEPSRRWSVLLAYAFTDAEVTEDTVIPVGDRLARVPQHSGRLALRFRGTERWRGFGLGVGLTSGSERELTLPNQQHAESYALLDLEASYEIGSARLGLSVVNLADEQFFEPYQYLAQAVVIPTRPRSIVGTLRWVF